MAPSRGRLEALAPAALARPAALRRLLRRLAALAGAFRPLLALRALPLTVRLFRICQDLLPAA
eukprot:2238214-Alexandrium_andersonii.AAC.1